MILDEAMQSVEPRPAAYVLSSSDGAYLYKGSCRNLATRLQDHHAGRASRTRHRRPLSLVHHEYFDDYTAARKRENYFKSGAGREWLKRRNG